MKKIIPFIASAAIVMSVCAAGAEESRAFWVVRDALTSDDSISDMVDTMVRAHCNVIFVQVCGRGDAYYRSRILPRAEALAFQEDRFDPLRSVIERAHEKNLQVHAWINVYFVWSAPEPPPHQQHVFHQHPEWIAYTGAGRSLLEYDRASRTSSEGVFLSPGHPDVKRWIGDVIAEIVSCYDVDGVHLDYIRYPGGEIGFNPEARTRFMQEYSVDPIRLFQEEEELEAYFGTEGVDNLRSLWSGWRCKQVTETVRMVRDRIAAAKPGVRLSAAVKPVYGFAREMFGQDWKGWMDNGLLDFVVLMAYSPSTADVVEQIEEACRIVPAGSLFAGLGLYNQSVATTVQQIAAVRTLGLGGISLFSYNSIADDDVYVRAVKAEWFQNDSPMSGELRSKK